MWVKAERRRDGLGKLMGADRGQFGGIEKKDLCLHGVRLFVRQLCALKLAHPRGIVTHCPRHCSTCVAASPGHNGGLHNSSTHTLW